MRNSREEMPARSGRESPASEALRESEERFRALFAFAPIAIFVCDRNAVIQEYNARAVELWGREPVRGVEQHCGSSKLWLPDGTLLPHASSPIVDVLATGNPARNVEISMERADGSRLPLLLSFAALKNAQGEITGAIASFTDIPERKQAEENLSFLATVSQDLARLTSVDAVMQTVGAKVGAFLNLSLCTFAEVNEAEDEVIVTHDWHHDDAPGVVGKHRLAAFLSADFQKAARSGEIFVVRNAITDSRTDAARYTKLKIGSFICVPLVQNGQWRFLLSIHHSEPYDWRKDEIELIKELTARIWSRLERLRAEAALHESNATLAFTLESAQVGDWDLDLVTDIARRSLRHDQAFGYNEPVKEWGFEKFIQHVHPDDRAGLEDQFREAVAQKKDWRFECRVIWPDGSVHWIAAHGSIYKQEDGKPTRMLGIVFDITERKVAEEERQRLYNIVENSPAFIGVSDAELNPLFLNRAGRDMVGIDHRDDISRYPTIDFFVPEERTFVAEVVVPALVKEGRWTGELTFRHFKTGAVIPVLYDFFRVEDAEKGRPVNFATFANDITPRKQAEAALRESERRFRELANNAPVMVWVTDATGSCSFLSESWYHFTGQTPAECLGFGWVKATHPGDRQRALEVFVAANAVQGPFRVEYRLRHHDGTYRWAIDAAIPRRGENGEFLGYVGSVLDIHDQKLAEEELRFGEARFRAAAGAVSSIVWTNNGQGQMEGEQSGWANFTGQSQHEYQGYGWAKAVHPEDAQPTIDAWNKAVAEKRMFEFEHRVRRRDGVWRLCSIRAVPVLGEDGEVREWVGVHTDITERKRADEKLAEAREVISDRARQLENLVVERTAALRETIEELEGFSYSISHDMRAPLRAMQSFAQILEEECRDQIGPDGKEYIRRIVTAADRMDRLIRDVLTYSKIARTELPIENVDVAALLNGILEGYPQFQSPQAEITVVFPLPRVHGNAAALTQCLSNLIGNAVKFVAPGVVPKVKIWAEVKGERVHLFVQDNGIGIDPRMHEKIFDIFYRLGRDYDGTGIGLAVVKRAAHRMGGEIRLESEPGKGSTFELELGSPKWKSIL